MTACCWRCGSTTAELIKVTIQRADMPKPGERFQCKDTLACISENTQAAQKKLRDAYGAGR